MERIGKTVLLALLGVVFLINIITIEPIWNVEAKENGNKYGEENYTQILKNEELAKPLQEYEIYNFNMRRHSKVLKKIL